MASQADSQLDVTGVCCPLPLMQIAKIAQTLQPGETLQVTGNDPLFESTLRDFCACNHHTILSVSTDAKSSVSILIRIGA
ncbi:MAG: sulfurtransferase TusA family protein [Gammaproteobacteria bacterium]|nr:sulfurtransferase TusA family protein [Gammaproteobacteria bacterium]